MVAAATASGDYVSPSYHGNRTNDSLPVLVAVRSVVLLFLPLTLVNFMCLEVPVVDVVVDGRCSVFVIG